MTAQSFGSLLREFRLKSHNPKTAKPLTQQEFGELLREEIGVRYSGAAISDWENNKSKIDSSYRKVLLGIIKVLKKYGGIKILLEANQLLEAGYYRDLTHTEQEYLFQQVQKNNLSSSWLQAFLGYLFFNTSEEFKIEWEKAKEGPPPTWPRFVVAMIRKRTEKISLTHVWDFILWVWIFVLAYWLITPSLQFPFVSKQDALNAMTLYIIGTLVLPFGIGLMVNTKDIVFWKEQNLEKPFMLRLYFFQGAYVGFHVAYFLAFFTAFLIVHFQIPLMVWIDLLGILFIVIVSYASAHLVPHNLWRAYQRLALKDGWVFFIFVVVGPLWAWFFLEFYDMLISPNTGLVLILVAITLFVIFEIYKNSKRKKLK